jgi:N-acetylglucosaminyldiphosphoundecaprenol N-acetyl-beta-D-mannosaminyltransferase
MLKTTRLLGVTITNDTSEKILEYVYEHIKTGKNKLFITTPNPEILVFADRQVDYKRLLNQANLSLPDGMGVYIASGLLGHPLQERIPGVDFMEELIKNSEGKAVSIGLLGGGKGIAKRTAECLKQKYPWIRIAFTGAEWPTALYDLQFQGNQKHKSTAAEVFEELFDIPASDPKNPTIDILFVAFGFPKQEEWIAKNLDHLPVKAAMGVGGAFDYISGNVPRAPYIIRAMGFEWLYRLIRQPWRFKRQLALLEFIWLVIKDRVRKKNN